MYGVKTIGIKLYGSDGVLKSNGWSNLVIIPKRKVKNAKKDIEASMMYGMYFKVTQFKDGYKISKNPISFKAS